MGGVALAATSFVGGVARWDATGGARTKQTVRR